MNKLLCLPIDIQNIIFKFMIPENYTFDSDSVYMSFALEIFKIEKKWNANIFGWFGTFSPDNDIYGQILHNIYNRPYSRELERSFGNFAKVIQSAVEKYKLNLNVEKHMINLAGTFGPFNYKFSDFYYSKLSSLNWYYQIDNLSSYFDEIDLEYRNSLTEENNVFVLKQEIKSSIIEAVNKYKDKTNNKIQGPFYKTNHNGRFDKLYYKILKPSSDFNKLIQSKLKKSIRDDYNNIVLESY